jgi:hypothetical protein
VLFLSGMKQVATVLLVAVAIAYYMGYEPWEFIPSWPAASSTPPPKVRHAAPAPAAEQAAAPQPQPNSGSIVIAGPVDDGSLEHRWKMYPNSSPAKP